MRSRNKHYYHSSRDSIVCSAMKEVYGVSKQKLLLKVHKYGCVYSSRGRKLNDLEIGIRYQN